MADGDALHIARTKAPSAVGFVRRHLKTGGKHPSAPASFQVRSGSAKGWRPC